MIELAAIIWFILLLGSILFIAIQFGDLDLTAMFPEGQRRWAPWLRLLSLVLFATLVLYNPIWVPST